MKARHDEGKLYPRIAKAEADLVRGACLETNEAEAEVMEGAGNRRKPVRPEEGDASGDEAESEEGVGSEEEGSRCLVCGVEGEGEGESEEGGEESDEEWKEWSWRSPGRRSSSSSVRSVSESSARGKP